MTQIIKPSKEPKEEKLKLRHTGNYCHDCKQRLDRELGQKPFTQKGPFCELGFTQNPTTKEATLNSLRSGAQVCHHNPFKYELIGGLK